MGLSIELLLQLSVGFSDCLFEPVKLLRVGGMNVNLGNRLHLNVRECFHKGGKLVHFSIELVVSVVNKTVLDGHDFVSGEAARVVYVVTLLAAIPGAAAGLSAHILLNRGSLNVDFHVSHDDRFAVVLAGGNELLEVRVA